MSPDPEISDEDVELCVAAMLKADGEGSLMLMTYERLTRAALAALGSRLLPREGETRTEWARPLPGFTGPMACDPWEAKGCANQPEQHVRRTITRFPDGSELVGPWMNVEEDK